MVHILWLCLVGISVIITPGLAVPITPPSTDEIRETKEDSNAHSPIFNASATSRNSSQNAFVTKSSADIAEQNINKKNVTTVKSHYLLPTSELDNSSTTSQQFSLSSPANESGRNTTQYSSNESDTTDSPLLSMTSQASNISGDTSTNKTHHTFTSVTNQAAESTESSFHVTGKTGTKDSLRLSTRPHRGPFSTQASIHSSPSSVGRVLTTLSESIYFSATTDRQQVTKEQQTQPEGERQHSVNNNGGKQVIHVHKSSEKSAMLAKVDMQNDADKRENEVLPSSKVRYDIVGFKYRNLNHFI